jgi:signal transduction histidine kinase/ligand-binding sensor domain-containing protein/DNA-binding response OmpR family regulator
MQSWEFRKTILPINRKLLQIEKMSQLKYLLFLSFFICHNYYLTAQYDKVSFDRVSANNGMPNSHVFDIKGDQFGFLWFGTNEGLFRYDGYEFKAYRHDIRDSTTLSSTNIYWAHEARNGGFWLATGHGLNKLDRRTGKVQRFFPVPKNEMSSKINNYIRRVFEDRQGNLWLASHSSKNFLRFDRASGQFIPTKQEGKADARHYIREFMEDRNGKLWATTSHGLLKLNEGDSTFQHILPHPDSNSNLNKLINGICEAADGSFWLATAAGLVKWNPETKEIKAGFLPKDLENTPLSYLILDSNGNPWFALGGNGLGVYDIERKRFSHFKYRPNWSNSLNNNNVTCIFEDKFRNIWVGTSTGFCKASLDNTGIEWYLNEGGEGNPSNNIFNVFRDSKGTVFTKTPERFYEIKKGEIGGTKLEGLPDTFLGIGYDDFLEDYEGGIWLAISGDGIYRRMPNEKLFRKMPLDDALSRVSIIKMVVDNQDKNVFWLGTNEGLCRLNWKTNEIKWYRPLNDLTEIDNNRVVIFEQYGDDEIWVYYTLSNSLGRFDKKNGKFELFVPRPEEGAVLQGIIKDMDIGTDGNIWIPTTFGLTNFNIYTKKFTMFGKREGMLENELQSVVIDKKQQIWVCGYRFFAKFDPVNNTFQNYLVAKKILHFHPKSKHLSDDGTVCFGSINGVVSFHPDHIRKNQIAPNVVLTDFKVKTESYLLDKAFEETRDILLSHHENDITFGFSGIHYINPEANEYKCRLQGYDKEWRDLGNEHKVSYTNLNPGQYVFQATAANNDGVWNEEGLTIQLTITPAFWQTLWFESLIILVVLSIGYALFKNRQHQLALQRQKELAVQASEYKTRFLADVSHEIRTPMNAIIGLSKLILDTDLNEKQNKFIKTIQQSAQNLLTIINDLLDHTKLEVGKFTFVKKPFNLVEIIDQLNDTFKYKAIEKNISFELNIDPLIPQNLMGDPLRLSQILTNLLGNALKFTDNGKVWLSVDKVKDSPQKAVVRFEVGDTGIGIEQEKLDFIFESFNQAEHEKINQVEGTGLGLSIARQLVERQGGQLFIKSELGKGSEFWFELEFGQTSLVQPIKVNKQTTFDFPALKILVVEDNDFNQMLIVEMLEKHIQKPEIEMAGNGKIALEKIKEQSFDIIIMDIKMPILDGYETTKIIRSSENIKFQKTPILAVTANALPEQLEKCKEMGMNDWVTKPIDEIELIEKIYALTNNRQFIDREKLKKLLANDEKRVQQYLDIFKNQAPEQIVQLKNNLAGNNLEQVVIISHNIKSQCLFLGLEKSADLAFKIEQLGGAENNIHLIPALISELEKSIMAVVENELT